MTRLLTGLHLCLLVVLCFGAGPALADATEDFESAEADWKDRRHWRYGTSHLFGLSRGMEDAGVPRLARPFLYVLTVPFDAVHLPIAAISGLFGD